ncbi:tetratricopeptide repeat protein [Pelovirga terrestris]|uniref:Tetratricopeptide repeat protein n=1 Tax=Pelovirga terrestris TaxID=2771352 RepID=A0A8J6QXJ7_9BACT|nr:tetratricopeptide repeat protein [Pelovirga terrestris]MBD1400758.1 tetratricopeptide repeat protein [Pelovirga terrestris]
MVVFGYPKWQEYRSAEPQRFLTQAIKLESLGRTSEALDSYQQIIARFPKELAASEALYRVARLWHFDLQDPQQALLTYLQLERDYPDNNYIQQVGEAAARIVKIDLGDDIQAIGYYQRLLDSDQGQSDQYLYEIADSYFRLQNYPQSRIELENLLSAYPDSPLIPEVLHRKATILILENRTEEANQDWQQLVDDYPDSRYAARARFNMAVLLEERGELELALEIYRNLEDYPQPLLLEQKINHLTRRIHNRNEGLE